MVSLGILFSLLAMRWPCRARATLPAQHSRSLLLNIALGTYQFLFPTMSSLLNSLADIPKQKIHTTELVPAFVSTRIYSLMKGIDPDTWEPAPIATLVIVPLVIVALVVVLAIKCVTWGPALCIKFRAFWKPDSNPVLNRGRKKARSDPSPTDSRV